MLPLVLDHHFPPTSAIAFNNAFLLSVRRSPVLRGILASPSEAARMESSFPNATKSMRRPVQPSVFDECFDAIFIVRFVSDPLFKICRIY
jgi:hypothetical protein